MFLNEWLQELMDERQYVPGRGSKICVLCIHAHETDFAKDVLLLITKLQVECGWIFRS